MNTNEMTNDQLRERIVLLERMIELETKLGLVKSGVVTVDNTPWYPDDRNWIEHSPENPVDRSKVVDFMYRLEREEQRHVIADPNNDYTVSYIWDADFNWEWSRTDIVAVVLKD